MSAGKRPLGPPSVIDLVDDEEEDAAHRAFVRRTRARAAVVGQLAGPSSRRREVIDLESEELARELAAGEPGWPRPAGESTCPICMEATEPSAGVELACGAGRVHCFCQECLTAYVRSKVGDGEVAPEQLVCPYVAPRCAAPLPPHVMLLCLPDAAERARFSRLALQRHIEQSEDSNVCPTAGCSYAFWHDPNQLELDCPACRKSYCLACRVGPWHAGRTCAQAQAERRLERADADDPDAAFERLAAAEKYKQCPKCRVWVQRTEGCDAMHCRCGRVFCYSCGGVLKATAAADNGAKECTCGEGTHNLLRAHEHSAVNHNLLPAAPPPAAPAWMHHAWPPYPLPQHQAGRLCLVCRQNNAAVGCADAACGRCCSRNGCARHGPRAGRR